MVVCNTDATARSTYTNLPYEQMHAPMVGPAHPFNKDGIAAGRRNHRAGHVEVCMIIRDMSHQGNWPAVRVHC